MDDTQTQRFPAPEDATEPAGMGHNRSPFELRKERVDELVVTVNQWLTSCAAITTESQADRAKDLKEMLRKALRVNDETRKSETDPLNEQIKEISARYKALAPYLEKSMAALDTLLAPWLDKLAKEKAERERQAREEAQRREREAEEARRKAEEAKAVENTRIDPSAPVADVIGAEVAADEAEKKAEEARREAQRVARERPQVRGEVSQRASGFRTTWKATAITDIDQAFAYYKESAKVRELLLSLASADARGGRRRIPGFKIEEQKRVA